MIKNSHFTKPIRTTLFVALILVLVALLSVALVTPKLAYAEANQSLVDQFNGYIKPFVDKFKDTSVTAEEIYKDDYSDLWINYFSAKSLHVSPSMDDETKAELKIGDNKTYWDMFEKLDRIFVSIFNDYYVPNQQLYNAAYPNDVYPATYAYNDAAKTLWNKVFKQDYDNVGETEKNTGSLEATKLTTDYKVLAKVTNDWTLLRKAQKNMQNRYNTVIDPIVKAIDKIAYLELPDKEWKEEGYSGKESETKKIYYKSKASIDAVTKLLDDNHVNVDPKSDGYEGKAIPGYTEDYLVAKAELQVQLDIAIAVNERIKEVRDKVVTTKGEEVYYTLKDEIMGNELVEGKKSADAMYNALEADHKVEDKNSNNVNDLQDYVKQTAFDPNKPAKPAEEDNANKNTYFGELEVMKAKIAAVQAAIDELVKKIEEIAPEKTAYTKDCSDKLKAAEDAFNALDADVRKHEEDEYAKQAPAKKDYFVENYEDLKKARDDWDNWEMEVETFRRAVRAAIKEFIDANEDPKAEAATYAKFIDLDKTFQDFTGAQQKSLMIGEDGVSESVYPGEVVGKTPSTTIAVPEGADATYWETHYNPNQQSYYAAYQHYFSIVTKNYNEVKEFNEQIDAEYNYGDVEGGYTYAQRKTIMDLWNAYNDPKKTPEELRPYVTNSGKLEQMYNDCNEADKLVKAWLTAVEAIPASAATIDKMAEVKTAIDAFAAIDSYNYQGASFKKGGEQGNLKPSNVVSDADASESKACYTAKEATQWKNDYKTYKTRETEYNNIITACKNLEKLLVKDGNPVPTLTPAVALEADHAKLDAWLEAVKPIEDAYAALLNVNNAGNKVPAVGEATQKYFQDNYADAWAIYQQAHKLYMQYDAESKILQAWTACLGGTENLTAPTAADIAKLVVTYNQQTEIKAAINAYDLYKNTYETVNDIRNHVQLEELRSRFDDLTEELNKWIEKVVALVVDPDYDMSQIVNDYETYFKGLVDKFAGYPLDVYKKSEGAKADGAYYQLKTDYDTLTSGADGQAKKDYLADAYKFWEEIYKKWDYSEPKGVKQQLEQFITDYTKIAENGTALTPEQVAEVKEKVEMYYALHESQRAAIKEWDKVKNLVSQKDTADAFNEMVKNLYEDVLAKYFDGENAGKEIAGKTPNITSLTPYYVNAIKAIYAALDTVYQANCREAYNKLAEIEEAYANAEGVLDLATLQAALDKLDLADANSDLSKKLADLSAKITALETFQGTATTDIAALKAALGTITNVQKAIDDAVAALKTELSAKITALETFQGTATTDINALKAALGDITNIQEAIDAMGGKVSKELTDKFNALEKSVTDKIAKLEAQLNEKVESSNADLQAQIDALKKDTTGLMAGIIVVAIVAAALVACVAVLFIKRKSN